MKTIFSKLKSNIVYILSDRHGEVKFQIDIPEPDKRKTYTFDGVKITANLFFKKSGKSIDQVFEDYFVKKTVKKLVNKN